MIPGYRPVFSRTFQVSSALGFADAALGTFLRSCGLHKADLDEWRKSVMRAAHAELSGGAALVREGWRWPAA